ncbi:MAG: polysaccharide deacetylase family protein [Planctomycetota bacterium]|nr:polysaccharide deacetylase family protein [Planctomycetota bacterium]
MDTAKTDSTRSDAPSGRAPTASPAVLNVLSIDVEDWYQLVGDQLAGGGVPRPEVLERQMDRILDLLARHECRATFFCLGKSLQHCPQIVQRIADSGHEVASHGWGHEVIQRIGLDRFRADLARSLEWLSDLLGRPVRGYRAPAFSVTPEQLEGFFDICFEAGLHYDSSVFPIRGRRYGIDDHPIGPTVVRERGDRRLVELPLATVCWLGRRWAMGGGGYWRLFPRRIIQAAVARINAEGRPVITYFHPYEFDDRRLRAARATGAHTLRSARCGIKQNLGRRSVYKKLDAILTRYRFGAMEDYLKYVENV